MRMYDLIVKKRDDIELTKKEIDYIINGYMSGTIPDYQISAFLMAIYFSGMSEAETYFLTDAMKNSGGTLDLSNIHGIKVDKHSTGGVGDKTSLVLAPMVAACGVPVAKMSGRGLGHTGGTIDKLESFPGFHTSMTEGEFVNNVNDHKIAIAGQTTILAPADKKLYALRDVTGTVNSIPLIASSIMSKKLASGADAIVLDVKMGNGAFMEKETDALILAEKMLEIGKMSGKKMTAVISDMNQPLGYAVGNIIEVKESIQALKGEGPEDLMELCYTLGSLMLLLGERVKNTDEGRKLLENMIYSGKAYDKFVEFIKSQGGDVSYVDDPSKFPVASIIEAVYVKDEGYLKEIDSKEIGKASLILGGGRETKESKIDLSVGVLLNKKIGDRVKKGDVIAYIHGNHVKKVEEAKKVVREAFLISSSAVAKPRIIKKILNS